MARPRSLDDLARVGRDTPADDLRSGKAPVKKKQPAPRRKLKAWRGKGIGAAANSTRHPQLAVLATIAFLISGSSLTLWICGQVLIPINIDPDVGATYRLVLDGGIDFAMRDVRPPGLVGTGPWWKFESRWYKQNPDTDIEFPGFEWHERQELRDVGRVATGGIYILAVDTQMKVQAWLFIVAVSSLGIICLWMMRNPRRR